MKWSKKTAEGADKPEKQEKASDRPEKQEKAAGRPAVDKAAKGAEARGRAGVILFSLALAGILFLVLMDMEKRMLTDYARGQAVAVKKELPEGLELTAGNVNEYLELREFEAEAVPAGAVSTVDGAVGRAPAIPIGEGVILTRDMLENRAEAVQAMEEPVLAGFRAEDISQMVCGTLRAGDVIHIYVIEKEDGSVGTEGEPAGKDGAEPTAWEKVLVEQVFDGSGVKIEPGDPDSGAQMINVLMEKADVERFYRELEKGSLRVAKER